MGNDLNACCAHEGKTGTEEYASVDLGELSVWTLLQCPNIPACNLMHEHLCAC